MADEHISFAQVEREVSQAAAGWEAGTTALTMLSPQERELRLGYTPGPGEPSLSEREAIAQASLSLHVLAIEGVEAPARPASYDLRSVGGSNFVTPVKDQGGCGSCVAFGTCATVETTMRVARQSPGLTIDLSEAHLFYCIARSQGRTCGGATGGWWVPPALDAFQATGVADEACYPYVPGDQNCTNRCADWQQRVTKISGWSALAGPEDMKNWLSTRGALAACFTVYNDFFAYRTGVYRHVTGNVAGGHCVCVVGYDDAAQCWICKNSWGAGWGDAGFFRIAYGECGIDATMWGVAVLVSAQRAPLYRYWNPGICDHFYTTNWAELGGGKYGWNYEGIQCYVATSQLPGTVPLYRYWNPTGGDHFYTTNWAELGGGKYGWNYEGIQCYVAASQLLGTVPLYRYWNPSGADHFYTTSWAELGSGKYGWNYEGIQCYVFTTAAAPAAPAPTAESEVPSSFRVEGDTSGSNAPITGEATFLTSQESARPASFTLIAGAPTPEAGAQTTPPTFSSIGGGASAPVASVEVRVRFVQQ